MLCAYSSIHITNTTLGATTYVWSKMQYVHTYYTSQCNRNYEWAGPFILAQLLLTPVHIRMCTYVHTNTQWPCSNSHLSPQPHIARHTRNSAGPAHIAVHLETWHRSTSCGGAGQDKGFVKEVSLKFLKEKSQQLRTIHTTHYSSTRIQTYVRTYYTIPYCTYIQTYIHTYIDMYIIHTYYACMCRYVVPYLTVHPHTYVL